MSDPRRRATQKQNPMFGAADGSGPNHVSGERIQHPVFGACRLWIKGGSVYRVGTEKPVIQAYEYSVYDRRHDAVMFRKVLDILGISG